MKKDKLIKILIALVYGFVLHTIIGAILIGAFELDLNIMKYKILHFLIFMIIWVSTTLIYLKKKNVEWENKSNFKII